MLPAANLEGKPVRGEQSRTADRHNEWNKALSRWFFLVATILILFWLKSRDELAGPLWGILAFVAGAVSTAALIHALLWRGFCPIWFKFVTIVADQVFVSVLVLISGGNVSMFFPAYYIVLFSNASRYGMGMSLFAALTFNVAYVVMLLEQHHPVAPTHIASEGVRILFFWAAAVYIGVVSSRFHRLARVIESHEETIRALRAPQRNA